MDHITADGGYVQLWNLAPHWRLLREVRTWELQLLRRLLRLRRRPGENAMSFNMRSAVVIQKWMHNSSLQPAFAKVIKSVYKAAWKMKVFSLDDGAQPLLLARFVRDQLWWKT